LIITQEQNFGPESVTFTEKTLGSC